MNDWGVILNLALGVAFSMLWERRSGFSSGGLVAPGVLSLSLYAPERVALGIAIAFGSWGVLALVQRRFCLYGRTRAGAAMLAALVLRAAAGQLSPDPFWFGWVVPGLIAADMQRQGCFATLASLFICSFAAFFASELICFIVVFLS